MATDDEPGADEPALDAGGGLPADVADPPEDDPPDDEPPDDEQPASVAAPRARIADHANSREGNVFTALISFHGARGAAIIGDGSGYGRSAAPVQARISATDHVGPPE